jgi:hypothetical protein
MTTRSKAAIVQRLAELLIQLIFCCTFPISTASFS